MRINSDETLRRAAVERDQAGSWFEAARPAGHDAEANVFTAPTQSSSLGNLVERILNKLGA